MGQITKKDLNTLVKRLNMLVNGEHVENGYKPGQYIIGGAFTYNRLERVETVDGVTKATFVPELFGYNEAYFTKRRLYNFLVAFIYGIELGKEVNKNLCK